MIGLWLGILAHLWQATLVLGVIALLALALRRAPARYQEGLWTLGLVKLLLPVSLLVSVWPALKRFSESAGRQETFGPAIQSLSQFTYPEMLWVPAVETSSGSGFIPAGALVAATILWVVGAATLLALWWRRGRDAVPLEEKPWHATSVLVDRLSRAARAADVPLSSIRVTDAAVVPCVRGFRKPRVLIPKALVEHLSIDEMAAVLIHENAHRERADLWRYAIQGIATRIFFFYPPAWWLARRLRDTAEMACDEAVLAAGVDARTYARALARTVDLGLTPAITPALSSRTSLLRVRLQRIQDEERYVPMKRHRLAVAVAVVAALALSFVPGTSGTVAGAAVAQGPQQWNSAAELSGLNGLQTAVSLRFANEPLENVLRRVGAAAGFDIYLMVGFDLASTISVSVASVSAREALDLLAEDALLEYSVYDATTLMVRPRGGRTPEVPVDTEVEADEVDRAIQRAIVADRQLDAEAGPMYVGGDIAEPERVSYVAPEYPEVARRDRVQGTVIVVAEIDQQGNVAEASVLRGISAELDEAAANAVRQWKYTPTYYNGEAVEVLLHVTVRFQLIK